ncbi:MAG: serine/threonine-protein phosphatase [Phycisphaerales bacterium]|nr:serine/threonine-protein phosphatase [Phycisphaerales bacterium]
MAEHDTQRMQCMEVWGGNQPVDSGVVMAGLDAWVFSRPYAGASAGGDVHYVSSCATGRITRLLVADVSGHGSAVAETSLALRSLMRRYVNFIDQTQFVRSLNDEFTSLSESGTFATAVVTTYFAPSGEISLCNAGHPPPLLYRAKTRTWSLVEASDRPTAGRADADTGPSNLPLGIIDLASYEQFSLRLRTGDLVLCYTDSLIESKNAAGEMLQPAGLLEIVRSLNVSDPSALIPALIEAIRKLNPDNLTEDDVTMLLFRPNGLAPAAPFWQRVLAPLRVVGAIARSFLPGGGPAPWPEMSLSNLLGLRHKSRVPEFQEK